MKIFKTVSFIDYQGKIEGLIWRKRISA